MPRPPRRVRGTDGGSRPATTGGAYSRGSLSRDVYVEKPGPPTMVRSRVQVATAYSPGGLFTFEGGRGICLSVPIARPKEIAPARANMIFDGMKEYVETWLARARSAIHPDVDVELCVDGSFIRFGTIDEIQIDRIQAVELTEPSVVGYEPYPLLFQCQGCGKLFESEGVWELAKNGPPQCGCGKSNEWRQVDVVFAHWSGEIEPLSPNKHWWNDKEGKVQRLDGCTCGGRDFVLWNKAAMFSEWSFRCVACGESREVVQGSKLTMAQLMPLRGRSDVWREPIGLDINMLPVSYRASSLHYVQSGRFIAIDGGTAGSWMELFTSGREGELVKEVAAIHRFRTVDPPWSDIEDALVSKGRGSDLAMLRAQRASIDAVRAIPNAASIRESLEKDLRRALGQLEASGVIPGPAVESAKLAAQLKAQGSWCRKRNPVRLTVEHRAFVTEHIQAKLIGRRTLDLRQPDREVFQEVENPAALGEYQAAYDRLLLSLGIERLYLIRNLPVVEYTFGYTRVSATPVYEREQGNGTRAMPVRLCAFPRMYGGKRPVYVMEQENEALYIRLREGAVRAWLQENGVPVDPATSLGAAYLEGYEDFGEFLDAYKTRVDGQKPRAVANYVFSLLHSMSHVFIHALADLSGLDADGIGEQVYPADVAFVLYRKGMTPDLGNVSGMWRNRGLQFLGKALSPRSLRCGSGSLCDHRGGACPACIMTPDIACIAHNQLLSRSMLAGGRCPTWEPDRHGKVRGYLDVCRADL